MFKLPKISFVAGVLLAATTWTTFTAKATDTIKISFCLDFGRSPTPRANNLPR